MYLFEARYTNMTDLSTRVVPIEIMETLIKEEKVTYIIAAHKAYEAKRSCERLDSIEFIACY